MILVELNGGLGNQLFQYALGRRISLEKDTELRFDLRLFKVQQREYKLHHFSITGVPATPVEIDQIDHDSKWDRILGLAQFHRFRKKWKPYYRRQIVEEQVVAFDENILRCSDHVLLRGYWQSEKYFKSVETILRQDLTVNNPLSGYNRKMAEKIGSTVAVSMHFRRGDYVRDPSINRTHGTLPLEYYQAATDLMIRRLRNPTLFIFSDDILWAKENIHFHAEQVFIDQNSDKTDYEDLRLMSYCQHHIIANSSFSWWGAWLRSNEDKIVVAPQKWFAGHTNPKDLIPENWITI